MRFSICVIEPENYKFSHFLYDVCKSFGRNQGINLSQGEFILLLNNDVVVSEGWLTGMLECLNRVPVAGIVGPMTNSAAGLQQVTDEAYLSIDYLDKYAEKFKEQYSHRQIPCRNIAGFACSSGVTCSFASVFLMRILVTISMCLTIFVAGQYLQGIITSLPGMYSCIIGAV